MEDIIINDMRLKFQKTTFSNYKKNDVLKKIVQSIYYQKIEESFFWTCELLCSFMLIELWDIYLNIMSKYIHIHNPKLPIILIKNLVILKKLLNMKMNYILEIINLLEIYYVL